jgi:hypothetical protein
MPCIELVVAAEHGGPPVQRIAARARDQIDDGPAGVPVFGAEHVAENLELLNGVGRERVLHAGEQVTRLGHAVHDVARTPGVAAKRREPGRAALRRHTRRHRQQVDVIAPGERKIIDLLGGDGRPERRLADLDQRRFAGDGDGFLERADAQLQVDASFLADGKTHRLAADCREARKLRHHLVAAGLQCGDAVPACSVGDHRAREAGFFVACRDGDAGQDRAGFVGDGALHERGCDLRIRGAGMDESEDRETGYFYCA